MATTFRHFVADRDRATVKLQRNRFSAPHDNQIVITRSFLSTVRTESTGFSLPTKRNVSVRDLVVVARFPSQAQSNPATPENSPRFGLAVNSSRTIIKTTRIAI